MANVLVLKSSINGETSLTNQLINEFLAARRAAGHRDRLTEHDLSAMALPTLDRPLFAALRGAVDPQPPLHLALPALERLFGLADARQRFPALVVKLLPLFRQQLPTGSALE